MCVKFIDFSHTSVKINFVIMKNITMEKKKLTKMTKYDLE